MGGFFLIGGAREERGERREERGERGEGTLGEATRKRASEGAVRYSKSRGMVNHGFCESGKDW
jgi:hypothetical protein